jgi:hypothetical protein
LYFDFEMMKIHKKISAKRSFLRPKNQPTFSSLLCFFSFSFFVTPNRSMVATRAAWSADTASRAARTSVPPRTQFGPREDAEPSVRAVPPVQDAPHASGIVAALDKPATAVESELRELRELREEVIAMRVQLKHERDKNNEASMRIRRLAELDRVAVEQKWDLAVVGRALGWDAKSVTTFTEYVDEFGKVVVELTDNVDNDSTTTVDEIRGASSTGAESHSEVPAQSATAANARQRPAASAATTARATTARAPAAKRRRTESGAASSGLKPASGKKGKRQRTQARTLNLGNGAHGGGSACSSSSGSSSGSSSSSSSSSSNISSHIGDNDGATGEDELTTADASAVVESTASRSASGRPQKRTPTTEEFRQMILDGTVPLVDAGAIEPAPAPANLDQTDIGTLMSIVDNCSEQLSTLETTLRRGKAFRALEKRGDVVSIKRRGATSVEREKFVVTYWTGGAEGQGRCAEKDLQLPVFKITRALSMVEKVKLCCSRLDIDEITAIRLAARVDTASLGEILKRRGSNVPGYYLVYRDFVAVVEVLYTVLQHEQSSPPSSSPAIGDNLLVTIMASDASGVAATHAMAGSAQGLDQQPATRESVPLPVARGSPISSPVRSLARTPQLQDMAASTPPQQ